MGANDREVIDFSVFLVHRLAEAWKRTPAEAYRTLARADAIKAYIVPFYDVLHTLGADCLVDDLTRFVAIRGVTP